MPYAAVEDRRAVARSHYQRNKAAYNPGREVARAAYKTARAEIVALSHKQWVPPWLVWSTIDGAVEHEYYAQEFESSQQVQWVYDLAREWCLRGTVGWIEGGVFLGESPFIAAHDAGNEWARGEFLKRMPRASFDNCRAESLILNLTLKRIKLYGR